MPEPRKDCHAIYAPDWMIIDAVRYAMGRRSYQVNVTCQWLLANWWSLPTGVANQIQRDVEEEFTRAERTGDYSGLGMECDRKEWEDVRKLWSKP